MLRRLSFALLLATLVVTSLSTQARTAPTIPGRDTRLFHLDAKGTTLVGPASHLPGWLSVQLASATMDQPQFWPDEQAHLKIAMPGRPHQPVKVTFQKRDATPTELAVTLDAEGLAVLTLLDGTTNRLQLGEYRADVATLDGKAKAHATFAVVEGTLGSLSLGYEMKQATSSTELDQMKGGWFLGNAAPGSRWGNGLSFKNQLRVDNEPYTGEVELISRCMLAGCNGIPAGPGMKLRAVDGQIAATLNVGGHSGPFQVEFVTPYGSLRHQFEGSGHVERDLVLASGGMRWTHHAGLAPYEGTVQVPGRQVFVQKAAAPLDDAFELPSVIAVDGKVAVTVRLPMQGAKAFVWTVQADGTLQPREQKIPGVLKSGDVVQLEVAPPYSLVTIGAMYKGGLREGWAMAFPPASWHVTLTAPQAGEPLGDLPVDVLVVGADGQGAAVSGVLEVYDNRVASPSPAGPLASAVGDSVRAASSNIAGWVDPVELEKQRKREEAEARKAELEEKKREQEERRRDKMEARKEARQSRNKMMLSEDGAMGSGGIGFSGSGSGGGGVGYGRASVGRKAMVARAPGGHGHGDDGDAAGEGVVRQGEKKVVFCQLVHTGADGKLTVHVPLPPQTGRVTMRFVAVKGLDWGYAQRDADVKRTASIDAKLPRLFVPGAKLDVRVLAVNDTKLTLKAQASGAGVDGTWTQDVAPGHQTLTLPWTGRQSGTVTLLLVDPQGKVRDRRALTVRDLSEEPVTWTRLEFGGRRPIALKAGETAVGFAGPGALMKGVVMNVVTATDSWFPHAEALSARIAARAAILHAISRKLLDDEGMAATLRADLLRDVRDLRARFFDNGSAQFRPWPGMAPNPRWTAWVDRNLHAGLRHVRDDKTVAEAARLLADTVKLVDAGIKARGEDVKTTAGFDPDQDGLETVPIEVDGKLTWHVVTDDAVQRFVIEQLAPNVDPDAELADSRQLDKFRLLRAFERTGRLQLLTESAKAAWLAGPKGREAFDRLYAVVARGMVFTQEPGMIQGPALLGGVYSAPMALVRFLEVTMLATERKATAGAMTAGGQKVAYGRRFEAKVATVLQLPEGAVVRIDRPGKVAMTEGNPATWVKADLQDRDLAVGEQSELAIELGADKDPLEYYVLVAVPTTTAIRQTEDILSDYKGQLIHGQQGTGSGKMQVIAVPFRGSRTVRLWLEGLLPGTSPGYVVVRHLQRPELTVVVKLPDVRVRPIQASVRAGEKNTAGR